MKKILRFAGAFAAVAVFAFIAGWWTEHAKASKASDDRARCMTQLDGAAIASSRSQGLVDLYRARTEAAHANFGTAADLLTKAKTACAPQSGTAIDKAAAAVKAQDAASPDRIDEAISAAEAASH